MASSKIIKLYASCIPVKGWARSVIYDLQRETFEFIPNDMFTILTSYDGRSLNDIYTDYDGKENKQAIDEYIDFLLEKEYIFFVDSIEESHRFPKLDFTYLTYNYLNNAILEYSFIQSTYSINEVIAELEALNCKDIEIRLLHITNHISLQSFMNLFNKTCIQNINLMLPYVPESSEILTILSNSSLRLNQVIFSNCPYNKTELFGNTNISVYYSVNDLYQGHYCGNIHPNYFRVNMDMFKESLEFNNCLNRKVFIDSAGDIKNCPAGKITHGNIYRERLQTVFNKKTFQELWYIKKDTINTCKVCEFRYMCSDCRIHVTDNRLHEKPSKCKYDPFTAKWE